jgi:predicted AAA+ superfamily ATPase
MQQVIYGSFQQKPSFSSKKFFATCHLCKYGNSIPIFTLTKRESSDFMYRMIPRTLSSKLLSMADGFPVLTLTGPRQSGKTTLVREIFPNYAYLSLENLDVMAAAKEDPRRFLGTYKDTGVIIDEAQRVPELFSYLQGIVDESGLMGRYILTGSQNFLLLEQISQSLAGRTAVLHLLPFTREELIAAGRAPTDLDSTLFEGSYPPVYDRPVTAVDFYPAYTETYLERDLRSMKNIGDLSLFRKFLMLCAGRTGQLLNMSALGNEIGIDHKTVASWISVLEACFVVFLLQPHHRNWNKRLVKQPKLYFYDTGLLCSLLGLRSSNELAGHHMRGGIFECYIIAEYIKSRHHRGQRPNAYFWRDHSGHEIDLLIENGARLRAVEIKSAETLHNSFFDGLKWFAHTSGLEADDCQLVYGGNLKQSRQAGEVIPWNGV